MKGKAVGCLSVVAAVTAVFMAASMVVVVRGLRELNSMLSGDVL